MSTSKFDQCGMTSYWASEPHTADVVLPSLYFKNAAEFFSQVKPPFYEDYEVKVIPDTSIQDCFGLDARYGIAFTTTLFIGLLSLIFFVY